MGGSTKSGKQLPTLAINGVPIEKKSPLSLCSIDKEMIRFKLHFLLFIGALGTALPYMAVFARVRIGLSATSFAAILTTQQFLYIFTKPFLGYIADYFNKLKLLICVMTAVQAVFLFLLLPIPNIYGTMNSESLSHFENLTHISKKCNLEQHIKNDTNFQSIHQQTRSALCIIRKEYIGSINIYCDSHDHDSSEETLSTESLNDDMWIFSFEELQLLQGNYSDFYSGSSVADSADNITASTDITSECRLCCSRTNFCFTFPCDVQTSDDVGSHDKVSDFKTYQFWMFAVFTTISGICTNSLFTLSDTACYESVQKTGAHFGKQRVFGAVGWGLMSAVGGFINDITGDFLVAWLVMAAMSVAALWNFVQVDLVKPQFSKDILKDVRTVLSEVKFLAFLTGVFLNGVGVGMIWFYLIWFLTSIGGSTSLCGLSHAVQCFIGEIPFMVFSDWIVKKCGHFTTLSMALAAYCTRFYLYSIMYNPWWVLPVEVLHGVTYGIFYTSVASYAKMSAKPGTEATTQSILFTCHEGLGAGLGCILGGLGFDAYGGHYTYRLFSAFAGIGMLVSLVFSVCFRERKGNMDLNSQQQNGKAVC